MISLICSSLCYDKFKISLTVMEWLAQPCTAAARAQNYDLTPSKFDWPIHSSN